MNGKAFDLYFNQHLAGELIIDDNMRMSFVYDDAYTEQGGSCVSLTLPTTEKYHADKVVFPFIENLLPEGEIRQLIETKNKIEDGNYQRLFELLGADVAGALSIQPKGSRPNFENSTSKSPLSKQALSNLLLEIQDRPFKAGVDMEVGNRLSLAGAQNKLPIILQGGQFYEAFHSPSTHIIKPARKDNRFHSIVYNEYVCMKAASISGINTANVSLIDVFDQDGNESDALLVERYDRQITDSGRIERIQQEDLCQLYSISSKQKYQVSGGPGFVELFNIIAKYSAIPVKDDLEVLKRLIFNMVIGNYDAHAKNFSFLLSSNNRLALSPAYDLVCTALYENLDTTFAMYIDTATQLSELKSEHIHALFEKSGKKYKPIRQTLIKFADNAIDALNQTAQAFCNGDYYQEDIDGICQIVKISRRNHALVLQALAN